MHYIRSGSLMTVTHYSAFQVGLAAHPCSYASQENFGRHDSSRQFRQIFCNTVLLNCDANPRMEELALSFASGRRVQVELERKAEPASKQWPTTLTTFLGL